MKNHLVFTICARNYIAQALVLGRSLHLANPNILFFIVIADCKRKELEELCLKVSLVDQAVKEFNFVCIDEINLTSCYQMALRYEALEFCTAIKPSAFLYFAHLFKNHLISYFDPDIKIYADLNELEIELNNAGIVVTPHILSPYQDNHYPTLQSLQLAGVFNFGYLGINPSKKGVIKALEWWRKQLEHDCVIKINEGIFVDQKWGNFFPCFVEEFKVLFHPGYNTAYWNLHERILSKNSKIFLINKVFVLKFFHFSGYSPHEPTQLSKHQNRIVLDASPVLFDLVNSYGAELLLAGYDDFKALGYGWNNCFLNDKTTRAVRNWYKALGLACGEYGINPFSHPKILKKSHEFSSMFQDMKQVIQKAEAKIPKNMNFRIYELIKIFFKYNLNLLFKLYQKILNPISIRLKIKSIFFQEMNAFKIIYKKIKMFLKYKINHLNDKKKILKMENNLINVFGYLSAELGVGESCRGLIASLDLTKYKIMLFDIVDHYSRRKDTRYQNRLNKSYAAAFLSIIHVNADQVDVFFKSRYKNLAVSSQKKIGYWYWELDQFPESWAQSQMYFDEIWVATEFIKNSIQAKIEIPVIVIPPAMTFPQVKYLGKKHFNIPSQTKMILMVFDGYSLLERKNPLAAIKAFRLLYEKMKHTVPLLLVIKAINLTLLQEKELIKQTEGIPVKIINKYFTREETYELIAASDCFLSLHRSEGLGLALIEAMSLGVPSVATAYSGNLDFMNQDNSFLVNYNLKLIETDVGPYRSGHHWAEPDIDHAVEQLARLLTNEEESQKFAKLAQQNVKDYFDPQRLSDLIQSRISKLSEDYMDINFKQKQFCIS